MGVPRLSPKLRKKLLGLLADDRTDAESLLNRLRDLRENESAEAFSGLLRVLAHLELPEVQAERLLQDLLRHRDQVRQALGRDPGLRVAAIDYLSNVKRMLANPTIVEIDQLEKTEHSAITDSLTGLYDRRYFMNNLGVEVRRADRYALRTSVLMFDLDGFKELNDQHGHLFGDLVLQRAGSILRRAVRDADVACRFGGDEFAAILPETGRLGAYAVAERVRSNVVRGFAEKPVGTKIIRVSLSAGIAAYPEDGTDPRTLVERADQALYRAKSHGRNRVVLFHSERRKAIRYPVKSAARTRLTLLDRSSHVRALPLNLSSGGVLLELDLNCTPATTVELTFLGRDSTGRPRSWAHDGKIVRIERSSPGHERRVAVMFDQPLPEECLRQQVRRTVALRPAGGGRV